MIIIIVNVYIQCVYNTRPCRSTDISSLRTCLHFEEACFLLAADMECKCMQGVVFAHTHGSSKKVEGQWKCMSDGSGSAMEVEVEDPIGPP